MQLSALAVLLFVAAVSAEGGYHKLVGIPTATRIKAREDRIHSEANTRIYKGLKVFDIGRPDTYSFFGGLIINTVNKSGIHQQGGCGSSLLNFKRLVTAAHCWDDGEVTATHMTVVLGSTFLFYGGVRMNTSQVFTHPNWNTSTIDNDIAIIYLPNKVKFGDTIFPIALPEGAERTQEWDLRYGATFGFGHTETPDEDLNTDGPSLRTVVLQIISNEKCSKELFFTPSTEQMCTSAAEGKGPCFGDSGGPLVTYTNRKFLVGITSYMESLECGKKPHIFTRVGMYIDFIASHAKLPKFKFHFQQPGDGQTFENITIH